MTVPPQVLARLKAAVGTKGFSDDPKEIAPHVEEWRGKFHGHTPLLLKPATAREVSAILSICHETGTPVVPQGGNTGLVGGQIPFGGEILLSLSRLNRVRAVDAEAMVIVAEAGAVLADVQAAAENAGLLFPLRIASEGSCTIGGNLSTNAGGENVLRYGTARSLALGLEAVLADGTVLDLLRPLHKDNTGYDLKQLFVGAEGTLGVITAAALKLFSRPEKTVTAFAALRDPQAALHLLSDLQSATGGMIAAYELMPRFGLELVLAHIPGTADPLGRPGPWYVLIEATGPERFDIAGAVEDCLSRASDKGLVADATIAASQSQRAALWKLRESMSEAQKKEGASIKHDVSLPVARIPEFLEKASAAVVAKIPGARPCPFGHLGDGNIHFNISAPRAGDQAAFLARWEEIAHTVHDIVHAMGGSISAEHGIGVLKRADLARYKSKAELDLMRALKRTLDPKNILNPGKLLP